MPRQRLTNGSDKMLAWYEVLISILDKEMSDYFPRKDGTGKKDNYYRYYVHTKNGRERFLVGLRPVASKNRVNVCLGIHESRLKLPDPPPKFDHKVYPKYPDFNPPAFETRTMELIIDLVKQVAIKVGAVKLDGNRGNTHVQPKPIAKGKEKSAVIDKIVFFNTGWMKYYEGLPSDGSDSIRGGGAYVKEHEYGHEIFNFQPLADYMYGYVQPTSGKKRSGGSIALERLGADKRDKEVHGILVVFVASKMRGAAEIVGWYRNATVYRFRQPAPTKTDRIHEGESFGYFAKAKASDTKRLDPEKRTGPAIPRGKGGIGQSNVWFGGGADQEVLRRRVREFVEQFGRQVVNEEEYQAEVQNAAPSPSAQGPVPKGEPTQGSQGSRWPNKPSIGKSALINAGFKCEIDPNHHTFVAKSSGKDYVEAHHLIPREHQDEFEYSLDVVGNIVSLCPNCHRKLHLATNEQREEFLRILFSKRTQELESHGIGVSIERFLELCKA